MNTGGIDSNFYKINNSNKYSNIPFNDESKVINSKEIGHY